MRHENFGVKIVKTYYVLPGTNWIRKTKENEGQIQINLSGEFHFVP